MNVRAFTKLTIMFAEDMGIPFVDPDLFDADMRATSQELHDLGEKTTVCDALRVAGVVINTGDAHRDESLSE